MRNVIVILEYDFKSLEDEIVNSASSPSFNQRQNVGGHFGGIQWLVFERVLEIEGASL